LEELRQFEKFYLLTYPGSQDIPALWPFVEGLFYFLDYFPEKEGFLNRTVV